MRQILPKKSPVRPAVPSPFSMESIFPYLGASAFPLCSDSEPLSALASVSSVPPGTAVAVGAGVGVSSVCASTLVLSAPVSIVNNNVADTATASRMIETCLQFSDARTIRNLIISIPDRGVYVTQALSLSMQCLYVQLIDEGKHDLHAQTGRD